MSKAELIKHVMESANLSKEDATNALTAVLEGITNAMGEQGAVQLLGFGTFAAKLRPERTVRNPRTGESMLVAETWVPTFKASRALKESVAKNAAEALVE